MDLFARQLSLRAAVLLILIATINNVSCDVSGGCRDVLVQLPSDLVLLNHFDYFPMLGRYIRADERRTQWNQLNGRHRLIVEPSNTRSGRWQLQFIAESTKSLTTNYVGVSGLLKPGVSSSSDFQAINPNIHELVEQWTTYNHTYHVNRPDGKGVWDDLEVYCMSETQRGTVSVCTDNRIFNSKFIYTEPNESESVTINDPKVNVFRQVSGYYVNLRPVFVQDDGMFALAYLDSPYFLRDIHSWRLVYNPQNFSSTDIHSWLIIYSAKNINEAMSLPELASSKWIRPEVASSDLYGPVQCSATLSNCSLCNQTNTDTCFTRTRSNETDTFYCVCKQGFAGETCGRPTLNCPDPPLDIFGRVPEYYGGGPFYPGEIITVSCNIDYPALMSGVNYNTVCTDQGLWEVEGVCANYSLLDPSLVHSNLSQPQLILAFIDEVERQIVRDDGNASSITTQSDSTQPVVSEGWVIVVAVAAWTVTPLITLLLCYLIHRCRVGKNNRPFAVLLSIHNYFWVWSYLIFIAVSYAIDLAGSNDVFFYLNMFTAVWVGFFYICYLISMFLLPEWSIINKEHTILKESFFEGIRDYNPDIFVSVECYHTEKISRRVKKTNAQGEIRETIVDEDEPVVTHCFRQAFKYETCEDTSPIPSLEPNCITQLKLNLHVSFADSETKDKFDEMKEGLISRCREQRLDERVNHYQTVSLTTAEHQLRRGMHVVVQGVTNQHRPYLSRWCYLIMAILPFGIPFRYLCLLKHIKRGEHNVRKVVRGMRAEEDSAMCGASDGGAAVGGASGEGGTEGGAGEQGGAAGGASGGGGAVGGASGGGGTVGGASEEGGTENSAFSADGAVGGAMLTTIN